MPDPRLQTVTDLRMDMYIKQTSRLVPEGDGEFISSTFKEDFQGGLVYMASRMRCLIHSVFLYFLQRIEGCSDQWAT